MQRKVDAPRRSGVVGWVKDLVFGRRQRIETFEEFEPGMSAKTFSSYIQLMKDEAERIEERRKRDKARNTLSRRGV